MKFAYFNPTVMAVADVPADVFTNLKNLVDTAHTKTELNDEGNPAISIRGGQQIQLLPNQFNLDIGHIKRYVEAQCQEYMDAQIKQSGRNDLSAFQPMLVSAWTIRQTAGDYQAMHNHEAHISGNIYIDVPDIDLTDNISDAVIEFRLPVVRNPAHFVFVDQWRFTPNPMKMIIFPSYIPHTVYPWKGKGYRTILAWDVKLVAKKI